MFYISILDPITFWDLLLGRFCDIKGIKISPDNPVNNTSIGNAGRRTIKSGGFWFANGRIIEQLRNGKLLNNNLEPIIIANIYKIFKNSSERRRIYIYLFHSNLDIIDESIGNTGLGMQHRATQMHTSWCLKNV